MKYIKEINKRFKFLNIIFISIVLSTIIYIFDYYNIPSFLYTNYKVIFNSIFFVLIVFIIREIVDKRLWNLVTIETINYFDNILFISLFCELIILIYFNNLYYRYILLFILLLGLTILLIRGIIIERLMNKCSAKKTNIYSISDLYNGNIENEELVLLEEKALLGKNNDLLDMDLFVDSVEDSLLHCKPKENFVMSLVGKWGCGKTSVINMLKEKINNSNDAVIGIFDPWKYDNKLSLFRGFYDFIFKIFGKNYGYFNYKELFKKYENLIFNLVENKTSISLPSIINLDNEKDIEQIKNNINDCIAFNDKKLIIVIDDIDRLDKTQILLIFKTIKTLFDFNNVIYILCYDEERINNIFKNELKIDPEYLKKIVQNKVIIPKIEKTKICEIGYKCMFNLLNSYNIKNFNSALLKNVLDCIFKDFNDLREIIRFINTISISIKCCNKIKLDICDYIALEYIKFKDIDLYNTIYNNSAMFVSEDREQNFDYDWLDSDRFNSKAKEFFDNLFKEKEEMKVLLSKIFPYVDSYIHGYELRSRYLIVSEDRKKSVISKRCSNGRYFKCYFTIRHSFFTELSNLLDKFINDVNNGANFSKEFDYIISMVNPNNYDLLFELLDMRLSEINDINKVFNYILRNILKYEDNLRFLSLNSNERAKILLASIINIEDNNEKKKEYLNKICEENLLVLDSVLYWLSTNKYGHTKEDEIYLYGKKILCDKLNEFIGKNINFYESAKYERMFGWLFSKHLENKEDVRSYLTSLINKNTIFKIIGESISTWVGHGVGYEYKDSSLEKLVNLSKIEEVLKEIDYPLNDDQEKIIDLYKNKGEKQYSIEIDFSNL